jgi:hypothetical protein
MALKWEADCKASKDACDAKSRAEKDQCLKDERPSNFQFGKKDTRANTLGYRSEKALPA